MIRGPFRIYNTYVDQTSYERHVYHDMDPAVYGTSTAPPPSMDTLKKDSIMNVPISALRDLWVARFGDDWAPIDTDDADLEKMRLRLQGTGNLEAYQVYDHPHLKTVYRIVK